jgi:hypothetical protein
VLKEAQFAAGPDHSIELRESGSRIGHCAEHEGHNPSVERLCLAWKSIGAPVRYRYGDRRLGCGTLSTLAQVALWLDGDDFAEAG